MGMIYLLWGEGTRSFKIGYTREDVSHRAWVIERYSPVPIRIQGKRPGTVRDERRLHAELRPYRSHGEWFVLPEPIVWRLLKWFGHDIPKSAEIDKVN